MTHYMQLLATNQPWNLLIFMAVPVILAETLAITELAVLFSGESTGPVRFANRGAGILAGLYFTGVFLYLMATAAVPLTLSHGWRGPIDIVAVGFYLFGIVPLGAIALLELHAFGKGWAERRSLGVHAALVGLFLVTAHVAMIAGMLDPTLIGANAVASSPSAHDHNM
jgi:hypothetical protein